MTNHTKYYIWLTNALGYASPKLKAIHRLYPSVEEFYRGGEAEWRLSGVLNNKDIEALGATSPADAIEVIARCSSLGITLLSFDDPDYPQMLMDIPDPPAVLYIKGRLPDFSSRLSIGIVGTRHATAYGKKAAHVLAGSLARLGTVIVSGGAVGIDSCAHTGALEADGLTVCILGCGIGFPYNMARLGMRQTIAQRGAVISEYPPDYPPGKYTFIIRNRLIAGLSHGVLVVEAGTRSGSLNTARWAAEQGKDVFSVMGNITSPYSQGTNALIKDGAVPVTDYTDILAQYPQFTVDAPNPDALIEEIPRHKRDIDVSDEAKAVYRRIGVDPIHVDQLAAECELPVRAVLTALTELELEGLVEQDKGRMVRLI
jgi:DNA processing protein